MGYRGKIKEQEQARRLRRQGHTLNEIARALGVSKSSASLWVREVEFTPRLPLGNRNYGPRNRAPNALQRRKQAEIETLKAEGIERIGELSDEAFLAAGVALYAGEGSKRDGCVVFANKDPRMVAFFTRWLRRFFAIDESRLRVRIYLHQGLNLDAATRFWSEVTGVPSHQFRTPYRAAADSTIRSNKHEHGCVYVRYSCSKTHRAVMGLVQALLSCGPHSGVAQLVEQVAVNDKVEGSSPSPGATIRSPRVQDSTNRGMTTP